MNDELKKLKIQKFISDEAMSEAVYSVLLKFFLKPKSNAYVNEQAASFMAIGLLQDAWKELEKSMIVGDDEPILTNNVGL